MSATSKKFPSVKQVWIRAWIVLSLVWCSVMAFYKLQSEIPGPSLAEVEARTSTSAVELRRTCSRQTLSVQFVMGDGSHSVCFRSAREADVYTKYFSAAAEALVIEKKLGLRRNVALSIVSGPLLLAIAALALDWILRGAGKGFLFNRESSEMPPTQNDPLISWLLFFVVATAVVLLPTALALLMSKSNDGVEWTYAYVGIATVSLLWILVIHKERAKFISDQRIDIKKFARTYFSALATTTMWAVIIVAGLVGSMIGKRAFQ